MLVSVTVGSDRSNRSMTRRHSVSFSAHGFLGAVPKKKREKSWALLWGLSGVSLSSVDGAQSGLG